MAYFTLPGERSPFSTPAAKPQARRKPKKQESGGFLSDLAGSVTGALGDAMPELGLGNVGKMAAGFVPGLIHLGTDWATKGLAKNDWSTYKQAGKGLAESFANTGATLTKPLGGDFWFEPGVKELTGYKPRDILERSRDKNVGLLPSLIEDVGNVALAGGAAGKVAKAGDLGTLANEARLGEEIGQAGNSTRMVKQFNKVSEKAQKLRDSGVSFPEEQIAARAKTIGRAETATHPYEALAKRVVRPVARAASERVLGTAAAEGAAVAAGEARMTTAQRLVAQAEAGEITTITDADAVAHLRETQQTVTREAIEASKQQLGELQNGARPLGEDLKLYAESNPDLPVQPQVVEHIGDYPEATMERVASTYDAPSYHNPADPEVRAQYLGGTPEHPVGLLEQVKRQYLHLTRPTEEGGLGVTVEFHGPDTPEYGSYGELTADLAENRHMSVRDTVAHGDSPNEFMAQVDPDTGLVYNDMFRAVHDAFGHSKTNDFGRAGELTAFREHGQWFTPDVQQVLATETAGQNASQIFSKLRGEGGGEGLQPPQKAGLMPQDLVDEMLRQPEVKPGTVPDPAKPIEGRNGPIEPETPGASPHQQAVEAANLVDTPGWSRALVDKLPMPAVRTLDRVNGLIARHDISVVARERARLTEAARRQAVTDQSMQIAVNDIAAPLVGKEWVDGTTINRAKASEIVGAELMARLDEVDQLAQAGGEVDPIVWNEVNNAASQGNRIPKKMIQELDLEDAIVAATEEFRRVADERLGTLIGGRLGTKGLEAVNEDVPTMTARQKKAWQAAQRLVRRKLKIEGRLAGELERETNKINKVQSTIDKIIEHAEADQAGADAAGQTVERLYEQHPFGDDPALKERAVAQVADETMGEKAGATLDTVSGETIDAHYAVAVRQGTYKQVTAARFAEEGPQILTEVLDSDPLFRDGRVRLGTWRHALEADTEIDGVVVPKGTEVVDIDPSIDSWSADPTNPKSPWRKLNRTQAVIIGKALGQESVWDGTVGDVIWTQAEPLVANLHSEFVDLALNPRSQFSVYQQQLRNFAYDHSQALARDEAGYGPHMPPVFTPDVIDAQMQFDMTMAHAWAQAHGKVDEFGNPTKAGLDEFFGKRRVRFNAAKSPRLKMEQGFTAGTERQQLAQVMLNLDLNDPTLVQHMIDMTPHAEARLKWYNQSHDAIEKLARGKEIVLGDGTKVDAADLMYQLIAVTSFQADPLTNLGNALNAVGNWKHFVEGGTKMRDGYVRGMQEYLALPPEQQTYQALIEKVVGGDPKKRISGQVPQKLAKKTGMYSNKGNHIKAVTAILSGHTLDKWTPETIMEFNTAWGGASKAKAGGWQRMLDDIPEDTWATAREEAAAFGGDETMVNQRALALHYGDRAWGKILSFWQNLADPVNSRAVTLDTWMARAFGIDNWSTPGAYWEYTRKLNSMADAAGVAPHQLQALIWTYAKQEITRQAHARVWATTSSAVELLAQGRKLGEADDPILQRLDWELARPGEHDAEVAAWDAADPATRGPKPQRKQIEPIEGAHGEEIQYQRKTGPADIKQLTQTRDNYLRAVEKANEYLDAGDVPSAQREISRWTTDYFKSTLSAEKAGDFADFIANPNARVGEGLKSAGFSETDLARVIDESLLQAVSGKARGFTKVNDETQQAMMSFFASADIGTLLHENMHAIRQILPPEDVATLERAFGQPGIFSGEMTAGNSLRRNAEELFVEEAMAYFMSGQASTPGLQPIMEKLRDNLRNGYDAVSQRGQLSVEVPEELHALWQKYLDPALPAEQTATALDRLGVASARTVPEGVSHEQLVARNKPLPGEDAAAAMRRQRRMDQQLERKHFLEHRKTERLRRVARLQKAKAEMETVLREGGTPLQQQIDALDKRFNRITDKLAKELEDPKTSRVPAAWQPITEAMKDLWKRAEDDPTLAAHMEGVPKTFGEILRLAAEKGFDPTHIRSFTPRQVERLVHETIRLGVPGRNVAEEIVAGTRKPRVSGIPRTQSLEALAAATVEATHEVQTNELVSFVETGVAQPVVNGVIPKGWEAWDPIKRSFVNGVEELPSKANVRVTPGPKMMIPKAAADALRSMGKSYNHWAFRALGKPSSWWRTFILTLSPRWYVNNFVGNFAMATAEGVGFKDWVKAWQSYRQRGEAAGLGQRGPRLGAAFADQPGVTGASVYHELESPSFIPPQVGSGKYGTRSIKGLLADTKGAPTREKWDQVKGRLARANEVVDELARSAVYHRTVRIGGSSELAIQRAYAALVDYGDLGPMERSLVRAVIPFYSWQKGVLKRVASIGYHDPAVFAVMQRLTDLNEEILKDEFGGPVPEGYQGLIQLPGGGAVNTRGFNPFQDAGQLIKAQGIAESANPIIEAIVRNELGAPQTARPEDYRINPFGRLVPETNVASDLAETFTGGLPQGQVIKAIAGEPNYPGGEPADPTQQIARFGGVNVMTAQQIRDAIQRQRESMATLNGEKIAAKDRARKKAFQKFSGRYFEPTQ